MNNLIDSDVISNESLVTPFGSISSGWNSRFDAHHFGRMARWHAYDEPPVQELAIMHVTLEQILFSQILQGLNPLETKVMHSSLLHYSPHVLKNSSLLCGHSFVLQEIPLQRSRAYVTNNTLRDTLPYDMASHMPTSRVPFSQAYCDTNNSFYCRSSPDTQSDHSFYSFAREYTQAYSADSSNVCFDSLYLTKNTFSSLPSNMMSYSAGTLSAQPETQSALKLEYFFRVHPVFLPQIKTLEEQNYSYPIFLLENVVPSSYANQPLPQPLPSLQRTAVESCDLVFSADVFFSYEDKGIALVVDIAPLEKAFYPSVVKQTPLEFDYSDYPYHSVLGNLQIGKDVSVIPTLPVLLTKLSYHESVLMIDLQIPLLASIKSPAPYEFAGRDASYHAQQIHHESTECHHTDYTLESCFKEGRKVPGIAQAFGFYANVVNQNKTHGMCVLNTTTGREENIEIMYNSLMAVLDKYMKEHNIEGQWLLASYTDTDTGELCHGFYLSQLKSYHNKALEQFGESGLGILCLVNGYEPGEGTIPIDKIQVGDGDEVQIVYIKQGVYDGSFSVNRSGHGEK